MIVPKKPDNEAERMAALESYGILDTLPEKDFDDITRIASEICQTPIAMVSLIDHERQWFKSQRGLNLMETPRDWAVCAHAILNPHEVMVVPDAFKDERFVDNPLLEKSKASFYAGAPLITPEGLALGTLCVMDHGPRGITEEQKDTLQALANQVVSQLELRKAIREVRFAHLALKRQNEELEQFAYIASHDLSEPLRTVSSFTELLRSEIDEKENENANQYLHFIAEAASRMTDLVSGLLDYSRIGRHRETHEVDCNELIEEVQNDLAAMIKESRAEILVGDLPRIHGNRVELRQLLQNLMSNAIKYSRPGVKPLVQIESHSDPQQWHIAVRDNGIGIEESFQKRIFVIFQRLHSHNQVKGSGIGLAHCKKIIELHNGQIWVESTLGEGSTFHFTLPR